MPLLKTYQETIDYLYRQLPMFSHQGSIAFKSDLTNIRALCASLGNPHEKIKTIHIGGTNGKGSVSHMLAAVFQQAGYKTGLYTSPHLKDFRERIRIDGTMIPEGNVVQFVNDNRAIIDQVKPSFFEITVAMAFDHFARERTDIAVIEVGLGGRLDSTNIITPGLSIITNISYDHQAMLGDTLEKIACEKAGIIKEKIPVVIGESHPETASVFEAAAQRMNAPIVFADLEWKMDDTSMQEEIQTITISSATGQPFQTHTFALDLTGSYQAANLCTVLSAWKILCEQGWQLSLTGLEKALKQVRSLTGLRGRWEIIGHQPLTVIDVGHNEAGIRAIMQQAARHSFRQLHIVTGFVKDKEVEKVLSFFPVSAHYYFCQAPLPRALDAADLRQAAARHHLLGNDYPSVKAAYAAAREAAGPDDMILICGSFFVVAEVI